jgi:two-component system sensor kinase FixL
VIITRKDDPHLPEIEVDPIQVQQVFVNLLRNAFDAVQTHDQPAITVETSCDNGWAKVAVGDNGEGIAAEAMDDLFRAFASGKRSGMGLGLAISRSIAQSHGGDLTVDPGGNGRGARFEMSLPLDESTLESSDDD